MRGAKTMGTQDREMEYLIQKALEEQESIDEYKKIIRVALGK